MTQSVPPRHFASYVLTSSQMSNQSKSSKIYLNINRIYSLLSMDVFYSFKIKRKSHKVKTIYILSRICSDLRASFMWVVTCCESRPSVNPTCAWKNFGQALIFYPMGNLWPDASSSTPFFFWLLVDIGGLGPYAKLTELSFSPIFCLLSQAWRWHAANFVSKIPLYC